MTKIKPKLLFFVTEDWYFCSHRIDLARAAKNAGYQVNVLTRINKHGDIIRAEGFDLIPLNIDRDGVNPLTELKTLIKIREIYKNINPDIVHHIALKPVIYGGLITLFNSKTKVVNLVAGFGSIFSSKKLKARILKPIVLFLLKRIFSRVGSCVVVQNTEDKNILINELGVDKNLVVLIKGSGVDIQKYRQTKEPYGIVKIALVSRLLWDKGIKEFVEAVKILKKRGAKFSALLVGEPDDNNMAAVSRENLQEWQELGLVECLGYVEDISSFWKNTHIAVLPSYREGLPKSLLEAAACGRPIVTTDTSGCKEVVIDDNNGFLVPIMDSQSLADALDKLINNADLRHKMGENGRERVTHEFSDEKIIFETLQVYRKSLNQLG